MQTAVVKTASFLYKSNLLHTCLILKHRNDIGLAP
jgi:hypothetical protein